MDQKAKHSFTASYSLLQAPYHALYTRTYIKHKGKIEIFETNPLSKMDI